MASILIIEDEPPIRDNLCRFLRLEGHAVFAAENGRRGLELLRDSLPDLIICDVMMPELDANKYVTNPFNLLQLAVLIRRRLGDAK